MLKKVLSSTLIIFIKNMNLELFLIAASNLIWVFLYKFWWINCETDIAFMTILGEIYFSIALSIIAGYIIFEITSEYPSIKRIVQHRFAYFEFILAMHDFRHKLCGIFDIDELEYNKEKITRDEIEEKVKYLIGNKINSKGEFEVTINEISSGIRNKFTEANGSFIPFPSSFYEANMKFKGVELMLFKGLNASEPFRLSANCLQLFYFLNSTIKKGIYDLHKLGSEKQHLEFLK